MFAYRLFFENFEKPQNEPRVPKPKFRFDLDMMTRTIERLGRRRSAGGVSGITYFGVASAFRQLKGEVRRLVEVGEGFRRAVRDLPPHYT